MLLGNGKSLEVRQDCAQHRAVLPALTELKVQPEPLAKGESTAQKSLPKIFPLLGVSGIWQIPLAFIFSFYLKEPDTSKEPLGMSVLQVSAGREAEPWLKCRQINSPVLWCSKGASNTPGILKHTCDVRQMLVNSLYRHLIFCAFTPIHIQTKTSWHQLLSQFLICIFSGHQTMLYLLKETERLQLISRALCDHGGLWTPLQAVPNLFPGSQIQVEWGDKWLGGQKVPRSCSPTSHFHCRQEQSEGLDCAKSVKWTRKDLLWPGFDNNLVTAAHPGQAMRDCWESCWSWGWQRCWVDF